MIIDIEPEIRIANETEKICMDMRDIPYMYYVTFANGIGYSVKWTDKELAEFLPNRTVSETLVLWEESLQREYDIWVKAAESGLHPYWTTAPENYGGSKEYEPQKMNSAQIESANRYAERCKARLGKLIFYKIILE